MQWRRMPRKMGKRLQGISQLPFRDGRSSIELTVLETHDVVDS